ncbi:MAG: PAS domain-containing protein, partial [Desulfatitalea sp.]|nr:PAS domain-containing protein [Desulfatitalea sp.]
QVHRESTEDRLRGYLQLLDALINTIPNPIYFLDAQGVFQGCNKVFARNILGLTRDQIIGRRPLEMPEQIPPDLAATYQHQEMVMAQKGGYHSFEEQVRCADGARREFLFSMAPIQNLGGDASGCVVVLSDLTEKNRAARDRLQREKLEGVLETAGAVCHEFNQPLQALSGFLEILAVTLGAQPDGAPMERALAQIDRMRTITAKLQGISHYETMEYGEKTKIIDIHKSSQAGVVREEK